jgi:hypothetical protein
MGVSSMWNQNLIIKKYIGIKQWLKLLFGPNVGGKKSVNLNVKYAFTFFITIKQIFQIMCNKCSTSLKPNFSEIC